MEETQLQTALRRLQELIPEGLKVMLACKDAVQVASEEDPENTLLQGLHRRFWEGEVALLQAHELLSTLERAERGEPLF